MRIGDFSFPIELFNHLDETFKRFYQSSYRDLTHKDKFNLVNQTLLELLQQAPSNAFLLSAVLDYIDRVNREKLLHEPYRLVQFEFWLNSYSNVSCAERYGIRAKIVGKNIPREAYQTYFPIGMQKKYPGSHFVVAHLSPDIDTTIASFWGFIDAFGAEVALAQHIWNLPGGAPDSPIAPFFKELFGSTIFHIARGAPTLSLTAMDLVTQKGIAKVRGDVSSQAIDHKNDTAILYVNERGHFLGDFRSGDVEPIKQITNVFKSCLYWFETNFHVTFISLFANQSFRRDHIDPFLVETFDKKLHEVSHLLEFPENQVELLKKLLKEILGFQDGLEANFGQLLDALNRRGIVEALEFKKQVEGLKTSPIFDSSGLLKEERPTIFRHIESIIKVLDRCVVSTRNLVERLDFLMEIKQKVLGIPPQFMLLKSDVEEIKAKMTQLDYMTVVVPEEQEKYHPVGIVRAVDLRKEVLGTASFRDFSNFQETKMASYLQVISVIDHHKLDLKTVYAPKVEISDAQSSNVLLAQKAFEINDRYGKGNLSSETIRKQLEEIAPSPNEPQNQRLRQRLLKREMAPSEFSIHPVREFAEYLTFVHAILDDTDLLSKVTDSDVECVASLLNRLKSIAEEKEVEIIDLSTIPRDETFAKKASEKILKNDEMYSVYKKIYGFKEQELEASLLLCAQGLASAIFADTKEQNGCCRVGQTKMFSSNFKTYLQHRDAIRTKWVQNAQESFQSSPELDFHLHMISTIPSADEVHANHKREYSHRDEIWLWIPDTQLAQVHLARFLSAFQAASEVATNHMELQLLGANAPILETIFSRNFFELPRTTGPGSPLPMGVLYFNPGTINSRKSMITPYLPRSIS